MRTKPRTQRNISLGVVLTVLWLLTVSGARAQQITGVPGSPDATVTLDGKQLPPPPMKFGGVIKESAKDSNAVVAAARRAAQGRAQRPPHHDRRPGLRRFRHLRRRHPDAGAGSHRQGGIALHAIPFHGVVLAHARRAHHGAQSSYGGLRRDRRAVHRLSGLRFHHRAG